MLETTLSTIFAPFLPDSYVFQISSSHLISSPHTKPWSNNTGSTTERIQQDSSSTHFINTTATNSCEIKIEITKIDEEYLPIGWSINTCIPIFFPGPPRKSSVDIEFESMAFDDTILHNTHLHWQKISRDQKQSNEILPKSDHHLVECYEPQLQEIKVALGIFVAYTTAQIRGRDEIYGKEGIISGGDAGTVVEFRYVKFQKGTLLQLIDSIDRLNASYRKLVGVIRARV
ncbi:hypothetical protein G9A89_020894 [Geosiphon pyriformis]|nr:hypothetical protein G9A89_020894 [Geosiphon pyriformis]